MALPKLNDVPYYDITIPSTGESARYRPYLVKEEKVLLIALESGDLKQISNATTDLIYSCLQSNIDKDSLTMFDIEYIFLKIRAKSVGEKVNLRYPCADCEEENDFEVNLDTVEVPTFDKSSRTIQLTEDVTVEMRHLSHKESKDNEKLLSPETYAEYIYESVLRSMHRVSFAEESIIVKDESDKDIMEFIDSLTTSQFEKLRHFVEDVPTVKSDIMFNCHGCGAETRFTLRGINDFFE